VKAKAEEKSAYYIIDEIMDTSCFCGKEFGYLTFSKLFSQNELEQLRKEKE